MGRRNEMTGVAEQFQYILHDESMHQNFGIEVINQIKIENPHPRDASMKDESNQMILEYQTGRRRVGIEGAALRLIPPARPMTAFGHKRTVG